MQYSPDKIIISQAVLYHSGTLKMCFISANIIFHYTWVLYWTWYEYCVHQGGFLAYPLRSAPPTIGRMILPFSQKSFWISYFQGHVTKTNHFWPRGCFFDPPWTPPARWPFTTNFTMENLVYHHNFNKKLKMDSLPPNWSVSKRVNSRLLHLLQLINSQFNSTQLN